MPEPCTWRPRLSSLIIALCVVGCGSKDPAAAQRTLDPNQCRTTADCDGNQQCQTASSIESPGLKTLIVAPCPFFPCTDDTQCGGQVCQEQGSMPMNGFGFCVAGNKTCMPACTQGSCSPGWTCAGDGHCQLIPCTDPTFPGCPESWYCDAAAAATGLDANFSGGLSNEGSTSPAQGLDVYRAGCRQLRCDETNGPSCLDGWLCEPDLAPATSVGCRALPCAEFGHCSNDDVYICEPTSNNGRYDGMDPHGCVLRNCEEGGLCLTQYVCDFTRPSADPAGCSPVLCSEPTGTCPEGNVCDPQSSLSSVYGCRLPNCTEGQTCAPNAMCDPDSPVADGYGCVTPINPQPSDPAPDDVQPDDPESPPLPRTPLGGGCSVDSDCEQGYCVVNICRATPGQCQAP